MIKDLTALKQMKIGSSCVYTRHVEKEAPEKHLSILTVEEREKMMGFNSISRRANFLGVRLIANELSITNEIGYSAIGSPYLINNPTLNISISHSKNTCAIATNEMHIIGLDIEYHTGQASKLISRFINDHEKSLINTPIEDTLAWSAKEALYKISESKGLSFKNQLRLMQHDRDEQFFIAYINFEQSLQKEYKVYYEIDDDFIITLAEPVL